MMQTTTEGFTEVRAQAQARVANRWPEWGVLFLYSALVCFMIPHHEPWADEAQGWMLARSASLWQIFHTYLHYEGQPGLWHLLLWLFAHVGVSYTGLHWICGALGISSIAVLLFRSPFPRWLKLSAPFTAFLFYQYPIIARPYGLITLLVFWLAVIWKRGPVAVAITLGLLANCEAHAFALSFGFACAYTLEHRKGSRESTEGSKHAIPWLAIIIMACFYVAAIVTAIPARDVYVASHHTAGQRVHATVLTFIAGSLLPLFLGLWRFVPVTIIAWVFVIAGLRARSAVHFVIPIATFAIFCGAILVEIWHAGLLVPTLLAILWITWPEDSVALVPAETVMRLALAVLIVLQIGWSVEAYAFDIRNDVSPDLQAATYLRPYVSAGDRIAVTYVRDTGTQAFHSVGIAPYFRGKLFVNQPFPFWWWSRNDTTESSFLPTLAQHPQIIVMEDYGLQPSGLAAEMNAPKIQLVESKGYHLARAFFAKVPIPVRASKRIGLCHLIFVSN